jgi:hypothetical protein
MKLEQSCCLPELLKQLLCNNSLLAGCSALLSSKTSILKELAAPRAKETIYVKTIRTAVISCTFLFALGAFAQYPAGGQATQPMQPQPQTQQPGMQPSQPSTQPSQDQNAQPGQQPGAATQPQSPSAAGRPSIDDQVQSLAQQLNLSADQQAKVKTALEDQHTQAMTVVQDSSMSRDDKIQKIHTIREGTINKVRTALNDDQKKKFDAMVQQQEQHMQQQQSQPKQ